MARWREPLAPRPQGSGTLLLLPVDDPTAAQVVRAELDNHTVVREDPDVVHPHLPADVGEYLVPVVQLHTEEGVRQRLHHRALNLDGAIFLGHILASSCIVLIDSCWFATALAKTLSWAEPHSRVAQSHPESQPMGRSRVY